MSEVFNTCAVYGCAHICAYTLPASPVFSPHDLRHRRISVLHRQGRSWAEICRFVGQRKLSIATDVYPHALSDGNEVGPSRMLATR